MNCSECNNEMEKVSSTLEGLVPHCFGRIATMHRQYRDVGWSRST